MKLAKLLFLFSFFISISIVTDVSIAAFMPVSSPFDDSYNFTGSDGDDKFLQYNVEFQLWQENDGSELYQYRYQVQNLYDGDDGSNADFQGINISFFPGIVIDAGWDAASGNELEPMNYDLNMDNIFFQWSPEPPYWSEWQDKYGVPDWKSDYIPADNSKSSWFWITSYGIPAMFPSSGDFTYGNASGDLPAPIPEPSTLLLLGTGIVGFLYRAGRKTR